MGEALRQAFVVWIGLGFVLLLIWTVYDWMRDRRVEQEAESGWPPSWDWPARQD